MAKDFHRPARDQGFLLPPDMRDWLPADHLVWFVLDVVAELDVSGFGRRAKLGAAGRAPLDPAMLLALLVYAYAHGQRSSRQIERLCQVDVAFRVICGNEPPDHTVIARFRSAHEAEFTVLFAQVLVLCAAAGLGRFATVAIDGTKIEADASQSANRSAARLRAEAEAVAERIVAEADAVDAAEDEQFGDRRGDELPAELADPRARRARIRRALEEIAAEQAGEDTEAAGRVALWDKRVVLAKENLAAEHAEAQRRWQAYQEQLTAGHRRRGRQSLPPEQTIRVRRTQRRLDVNEQNRDAALARQQTGPRQRRSKTANVTDPESRLLKSRKGFVQGYNAQLAVTDDQLITGVGLTRSSNDVDAFVPMMNTAVDVAQRLGEATGRADTGIGVILADAGYFSEANITAAGPARLIAPGDRRDVDAAVKQAPTTGEPPPDASPCDAMRHRLRTAEAHRLYKRRSVTVEPVIGHLKDRIGMRRFARRGKQAAIAELNLAATVHNLLKLHRAMLA